MYREIYLTHEKEFVIKGKTDLEHVHYLPSESEMFPDIRYFF
jgi:hypothetical protein